MGLIGVRVELIYAKSASSARLLSRSQQVRYLKKFINFYMNQRLTSQKYVSNLLLPAYALAAI